MIKPYGTKILVKVIEDAQGAIFLLNKEKPQKGIVVSTGSEATELPLNSTVSFSRYVGAEIKQEDGFYLLLDKRDVLTYE